MGILDAVILGIIQGLTEFLPVSSSGHLVLAEHLLGVGGTHDITFEVFLHFGTIVSIIAIYYRDIWNLITSVTKVTAHPASYHSAYAEDEFFRMAVHIVVATIPAGVVGLLFEDQVAAAFADPKLVATMLIVTGLILFLTRLFRTKITRPMNLLIACFVGCAQALAIVPGISRSGSTIATAMYWKVSPEYAARFSFLLSIPVVLGATLLKAIEMFGTGLTAERPLLIFVGTVAAGVSGYFSIKLLLRVIAFGRIRIFAFYCLLAGSAGILFL